MHTVNVVNPKFSKKLHNNEDNLIPYNIKEENRIAQFTQSFYSIDRIQLNNFKNALKQIINKNIKNRILLSNELNRVVAFPEINRLLLSYGNNNNNNNLIPEDKRTFNVDLYNFSILNTTGRLLASVGTLGTSVFR